MSAHPAFISNRFFDLRLATSSTTSMTKMTQPMATLPHGSSLSSSPVADSRNRLSTMTAMMTVHVDSCAQAGGASRTHTPWYGHTGTC